MKKHTIYAIFTVALLMLLCILPAQAAVRPNVVVTSFDVKEGSATVGNSYTLRLKLVNLEASSCARSITASIAANFPFIQQGINKLPVKDLCVSDYAIVEFPMKIDPTATGGFYQLSVNTNYETSTLAQFSSVDTLNLLINGTPDIKADIINSDPIDIYPGDMAQLTLSIENDGSFEAQSVDAILNASSPVEVKWAKSTASLGTLSAKQNKNAIFAIEIPKDAKGIDYPLSLVVDYLDENLMHKEKDFTFTLHVKKKAMFSTADSGSDNLYANMNSNKLKIRLKNTGTDTAYKIKAKILPQFPFSSDGSVKYIDSLIPGKDAEVLMTVDIDKDATIGAYALDLLLDFEDAQGKKMQDTAKVSLTVKPKGFFRLVFIDYWAAWIIILIAAITIIRRRMIGKQKKK